MMQALVAVVFLAGCALSAPPPERGSAPILTPQPAPPDVAFELPSRRPSVANGAAVYAEKCIACHGPAGRGDGEQAAQIQADFGAAPADLTVESVARASTPVEWFGVISAGRLESGMPPFEGSLSVDDRWDVIAYVWSLGAPEETLTLGRSIYAERCVQCHGETGKGDSSQAEGDVPDVSSLAVYQDVAPGEWDNALNTSHVPSFSGKLSTADRSAVIDYLRSFTYDAVAVVSPDATPAPESAGIGLAINGSVVNGTNGGPKPGNLEGTFFYFPGGLDKVPVTQTVTIDADGKFSVPDLEARAGDVVGASVEYGDVTYVSDAFTLDGTESVLDLPVHVYEQTTATDAVHVEVLHIIVTQAGDTLNVAEIYVVSNLGDRTIANTTGEPALRFNLPAAAAGFQGMTDVPGVYIQTAGGFGYHEAVLPGNGTTQLRITYQLSLGADIALDRTLTYPVNTVNLLVQSGDLTPSSDQLTDQGLSDFEGSTFYVFSGESLPSNQPLQFRIARSSAGIDPRLLVGLAALILGLPLAGYGIWRMRKPRGAQGARPAKPNERRAASSEREKLIDQIAALDDAFAEGEIAEAGYRRKREALKSRLLRAMRAQDE